MIPSFANSPLAQLLFYPALTLSDIGTAPSLREWLIRAMRTSPFSAQQYWQSALYLGSFAVSAAMSLWLLLKLKANVFETALATTTRMAERRLRVQQGRRVTGVAETSFRSTRLPRLALVRGCRRDRLEEYDPLPAAQGAIWFWPLSSL